MCRASTKISGNSSVGPTNKSNTTTAVNNNKMASSSSSSSIKKKSAKPAFEGASFDKDGNCTRHKSVQLAEQVRQDGRLLWKEIKMVSCFELCCAHYCILITPNSLLYHSSTPISVYTELS